MTNINKIWLFLEKSDETRISKGIAGYKDRTGEVYHYDSLVPNNKNVGQNDIVIIRKENDILGVGSIDVINSSMGVKIHKRCPECNSTDIRERSTRTPKWKCGGCAKEFTAPKQTSQVVTNFEATLKDFTKFNTAPTVAQVKACSINNNGEKLQNSIISLDKSKINTLCEELGINLYDQPNQIVFLGQGFGLTAKERKAVELRAMQVVHDLYSKEGWLLVDTSLSQPYDYIATKDSLKRFIEVKGSTGTCRSVLLTYREVENVRLHPNNSALVIVSNIILDRSGDIPIATGGVITIDRCPWIIDDQHLLSIQFRYEIT